MNHLSEQIYSRSCLLYLTEKESKGRSQAVGWCSIAVLPSLALSLQFHPPQGPWHGGSARCVACSWQQVLLLVPQAAPFPSIASSTLCCSQTRIFYGGHLKSLNFTF